MNKKYLLTTGESDYERLSILSKLYNPLALYTALIDEWFTYGPKIFATHGYNIFLGNEVPRHRCC